MKKEEFKKLWEQFQKERLRIGALVDAIKEYPVITEHIQKVVKATFEEPVTYPVLDEEGNFTKDAQKFLLPYLKDIGLDDKDIQQLRELIPFLIEKSERKFFIIRISKIFEYNQNVQMFFIETLLPLEFPRNSEKKIEKIILMSSSLFDLSNLIAHGEDYAIPIYREKLFSKEEIRITTQHYARGVNITQDDKIAIHDSEVPGFLVFLHDYFHIFVASLIYKQVKNYFNLLLKGMSQRLNADTSANEIWDLADGVPYNRLMVFLLNKDNEKMDIEEMFLKGLDALDNRLYQDIFLFELAENDEWQQFTEKKGEHYKKFFEIYDTHLKGYSFKIQWLKIQLIENNLYTEEIKKIIDENEKKIEASLDIEVKDSLILTCEGEPVVVKKDYIIWEEVVLSHQFYDLLKGNRDQFDYNFFKSVDEKNLLSERLDEKCKKYLTFSKKKD